MELESRFLALSDQFIEAEDQCDRLVRLIKSGKELSMMDIHRVVKIIKKYESNARTAPPDLNDQQSAAYIGILKWFDDRYESRHSLLRGYAGTGKTYTVQHIAAQLQAEGKTICFTSPTHKANQVLSMMAIRAGQTVDISTIHSLLGLSLKYNKFGKQELVQISEDKSYKYDLVVLDEGSMIGDDLWKYILNAQCRFLIMGDPAQLPPIEAEKNRTTESRIFSEVSPAWELTKVVRYDGAILRYVTDIRDHLESKSLPFKKFERGVFEKYDRDQWMTKLIDRYKKLYFDESPNSSDIRALAWTNNRVQTINIDVRNAIYTAEALPYVIGERLVAKDMIEVPVDGYVFGRSDNAKWKTGNSTTIMYSCDECVIGAVTWGVHKAFDVEFAGWHLDITTDRGDLSTIFVVDESEKDKVIQVCNDWKKQILSSHLEHQNRAQMWALYYKELNQLNLKPVGNSYMRKLQYAFALTIHQSQGSTFGCVFADTGNVFGCQDVKLRNQLLYVQGSRAAQELYIT